MSLPIYAEQTLVAAVADDVLPSLTYAQAWRDDRSAYPVSLSMRLAKETCPHTTLSMPQAEYASAPGL